MALGGSTNAVLHLLAIANEARVELTLDDFDRVGRRVPHIADMKPHGRYHMVDLDRVGGVPVVMRTLLEAGVRECSPRCLARMKCLRKRTRDVMDRYGLDTTPWRTSHVRPP